MFQIGDEIAGYRVEQVLGAGGMGEVYKASHPRLPRSDAIKVLRSAHAEDPVVRQRFEREADLLAPIAHPNLVRVYDRGAFGEVLWIAMELVPGTDASKMSKSSPAGMDPRLVVNIVNGVAAGLDVAHRNGVLHRDVKPANILITPGPDPVNPEAVKVTDFGIAQALGEAGAGLTNTGTTVGTMRYCSPEQIDGRRVDGRADVYSLAATAFELLTGSAPYDSNSLQGLMTAHLFAEPPRASDRSRALPPAVDDVLRSGLAKDPGARPPTATAFAQALYSAFTGGAVNLPPSGAMFANTPGAPITGPRPVDRPSQPQHITEPQSAPRLYQKVPVVASIAMAVALVLGVGGAFAWAGASGLSTPDAPVAKMTPDGVNLTWPSVDGADQYVIKQDDTVIDLAESNEYVVKSPDPGKHTYSVAARSANAGGSDFSSTSDLTVTSTWGDLNDIAKLYPGLISSTPVNTNTFEAMWCRGYGPYPVDDPADTGRAIICQKSDQQGKALYSVEVFSYADASTAGTNARRELPITADDDSLYLTAQNTRGTLIIGEQDGDAKAVFYYGAADKSPAASTYVVVSIPGSKKPEEARAIMGRLPF